MTSAVEVMVIGWARLVLAVAVSAVMITSAWLSSAAFGFTAVSQVGWSSLRDGTCQALLEAVILTGATAVCALLLARCFGESLGAWGAGFFLGLVVLALVVLGGFEGFGMALGGLGGFAEPIHEYLLALLPTPTPLVLTGVCFGVLNRRAARREARSQPCPPQSI